MIEQYWEFIIPFFDNLVSLEIFFHIDNISFFCIIGLWEEILSFEIGIVQMVQRSLEIVQLALVGL